MPTLLRTNKEIMEIYDRQVDTVYRVCYAFMKNPADAEDMTQETFLRLMSNEKPFADERHEKAWLIVTASNLCKDALKKWWRRHEDIEDYLNLPQQTGEDRSDVLSAILALPKDYKDAMYMFYYEGYSTGEIAKYLNCPESTVRSRLSRGRKRLTTMLGGADK